MFFLYCHYYGYVVSCIMDVFLNVYCVYLCILYCCISVVMVYFVWCLKLCSMMILSGGKVKLSL
jgi:hypothetical protein